MPGDSAVRCPHVPILKGSFSRSKRTREHIDELILRDNSPGQSTKNVAGLNRSRAPAKGCRLSAQLVAACEQLQKLASSHLFAFPASAACCPAAQHNHVARAIARYILSKLLSTLDCGLPQTRGLAGLADISTWLRAQESVKSGSGSSVER